MAGASLTSPQRKLGSLATSAPQEVSDPSLGCDDEVGA